MSVEERARALWAKASDDLHSFLASALGLGGTINPLREECFADALRAAEADAYARGKADGADEAATAAVEVLHRLRADAPAS